METHSIQHSSSSNSSREVYAKVTASGLSYVSTDEENLESDSGERTISNGSDNAVEASSGGGSTSLSESPTTTPVSDSA